MPRNPPHKTPLPLPLCADPPPADWVAVAEVGAPIGLKGAVRLHTFDSSGGARADASVLLDAKACWIRLATGSWMHCHIERCAAQTRGLKLQLREITDRDQAEGLRTADVGLSRAEFPEPQKGEAYWADLIGATVINRQGESLGEVIQMQSNGEHDWLVLPDGWIPYVERYIDSVDLNRREIRVDWDRAWFD